MPYRRHPLKIMHALALLGALLMAVAPVLSRWMQSRQDVGSMYPPAALCTSHGMQMDAQQMSGPMASHAGHAMSMSMAHAGMAAGDQDHGIPAEHDAAACDYCVLAAHLLPLALFLLWFPLRWLMPKQPVARRAPLRLADAWPAHSVRGPPLILVA